MKQEAAVELLKVAATLATAAMNSKTATTGTASSMTLRSAEAVFEDCVKAVTAHFLDLSPGAK